MLADLESRLASLLHFGTWVASALVGLGLALILAGGHGNPPSQLWLPSFANGLVRAGIGVFILLPVSRVAVMLVIFFRQRDYRFVAIAALVLVIIAVSLLLGIHAAQAKAMG